MKKVPNNASADLQIRLHDGVCQTLTALHLHASVLLKKIKRTCPEIAEDFGELERLIAQARDELHQAIKK